MLLLLLAVTFWPGTKASRESHERILTPIQALISDLEDVFTCPHVLMTALISVVCAAVWRLQAAHGLPTASHAPFLRLLCCHELVPGV